MTIESTLVKRRARYVGETGLFPTNPMASEDLALTGDGTEVMCSWYSPRNLKALNFLWGLVHKAQENTDYWSDRYKAMDWLKDRVGYVKPGRDPETREWVPRRPKSLKRISDQELRFLTDRIIDVICAEVMPGMKANDLKKEIEEMLSGTR